MKREWIWLAGVVLFMLSACGGGGGGGDSGSSGSSGGGSSSLLTLAPASLSANLQQGEGLSIDFKATPHGSFTSTVYVLFVDSESVLAATPTLSQNGDGTFSSRMGISRNLAVGTHTGNIEIHLCYNSTCNSEYAGSPVKLPYSIKVSAPGTAYTGPAVLTPASLALAFRYGEYPAFTITAMPQSSTQISGTVYLVTFTRGVVLTQAVPARHNADGSFTADFHAVSSPTPGVGMGSFDVRLCDSAECTTQYGPTSTMPYTYTISSGS